MNTFQKVTAALQQKFVNSDQIARVIALAIESNKNLLLWGPGGHGKSEMVMEAISQIFTEDEVFVQSFGEGMDEATLWGGLDFAALERDKVMKFFPENSFLAKKVSIKEEIFDAPASVLLSLKDTLTAKKLRKGSQVYAMKTQVIIALTNKNPDEISDLGPAAAALIERFPLQYEVKWKSYTSADYLKLFQKVAPQLPGADLNGTMPVLAEVMAKASESGEIISPRTAVHALGVVKTSAAMRGANRVEKQDLLDLCFLPGMEQFAETLRSELDAAFERAQAETLLRKAESEFQVFLQQFADAGQKPVALLQVAKRLIAFQDNVSNLKVTDGLTDRRKNLRNSASEKAVEAQAKALDATRE